MEPQPPPMMPNLQATQDAEHVRLLAIFHYVLAGLNLVGACFIAVYFVFFIVMMNSMSGMATVSPSGGGASGTPPPTEFFEMMSWFYGVFGALGMLFCVGLAWVQFLAGRSLSARRHRTFVFVVGCIECIFFPLGTALGIFTIIVLQRPSVHAIFERPDSGVGAYQ